MMHKFFNHSKIKLLQFLFNLRFLISNNYKFVTILILIPNKSGAIRIDESLLRVLDLCLAGPGGGVLA